MAKVFLILPFLVLGLFLSCSAYKTEKQKTYNVNFKSDGNSYSCSTISQFAKWDAWLTWGSSFYTNYNCHYYGDGASVGINLPGNVSNGMVFHGSQNIPVIDPRDGGPMFVTFEWGDHYPISNFVFTVTSWDRSASTCSGTFSGMMTNSAGVTNLIEDGTFDGSMTNA